jgi:Fur family transcriptional regulator, ferric uptake regulator
MFQRNTRQRQVILEELRKLKTHPTASGLYAIVRERLPKISLGTVYRNLEMLCEVGLVQKFEFGGGEARYDGTIDHHDHIRCANCGRLDDVCCPPLDLPGDSANDLGGYTILGHRLEYFGVCPACQASESSSNADAAEKRN